MGAIQERMKDVANYRAARTAREDFDAFWSQTLERFAAKPLNDRREPAATLMKGTLAARVQFEGYDDTPLYGWFLVPKGGDEQNRKVPCVVIYQGYQCHRGIPENYAVWLQMGYAVFAVDTRGQTGETGNRLASARGIFKGWMTQGVLEPEHFYGLAMTIDAWKALQWVSAQPEIDAERIGVYGTSQGGGLALQMAALSKVPRAAVANVPNLCHLEFALMNSTGSVSEIAEFVARNPGSLEQVLTTLSYFDNLNLAEKINIPVLYSAGFKDLICWPETIAAAYNRNPAPGKELLLYPFMGHEEGPDEHRLKAYGFLGEHLQP
ncbi:acetylxylan esterase [Paenibacillus barengoltzii]|uniref:acetylxylan esterase n=1 Tax=Paenibacillus barengoltzii TaxID=343517 RepID=UPI000FD77C81|nr:acetylxylan esterase [Paenibacillus barengoltzii]MEC2344846.1 acetylxylan esterase [Paenibacillus barengoltzii]